MSKFKFIKRNCALKEEGEANNQNANTDTASSNSTIDDKNNAVKVQLLNQIAQLNKQIADAQKECDTKINQYNQQKVQVQQKLADMGVATNENELMSVKGLRVFEALEPNNRRDMLSSALYDAIENSNLSYSFSDKECDNFARYIMETINNDSRWDRHDDKMNELLDIIKNYKKVQNKFGSSDSELNRLLDNIRKVIESSNEDFSWLIG